MEQVDQRGELGPPSWLGRVCHCTINRIWYEHFLSVGWPASHALVLCRSESAQPKAACRVHAEKFCKREASSAVHAVTERINAQELRYAPSSCASVSSVWATRSFLSRNRCQVGRCEGWWHRRNCSRDALVSQKRCCSRSWMCCDSKSRSARRCACFALLCYACCLRLLAVHSYVNNRGVSQT